MPKKDAAIVYSIRAEMPDGWSWNQMQRMLSLIRKLAAFIDVRIVSWPRRPFQCVDCGKKNPPMFILKDRLWLSIAEEKDILCLDCAEKRLGRKVTMRDLAKCGITEEMKLGARIAKNGGG
jgi:hypothetical protein